MAARKQSAFYVLSVISWTLVTVLAVDRTPIRYHPFRCRNGWSVSQTFQCDHFRHCIDGSDEEGCVPAGFLEVPPLNATVVVDNWMNLTCRASGIPIPIIEWKVYGKQPEAYCDWITEDGVGQLSCRMRLIDSGNYSCVARQLNRTIETMPTAAKVVGNVCKDGFFNEVGRNKMCIKCFCSGVSTLCHAVDLYRWNYTMAMNDWKMKYATVSELQTVNVKIFDQFKDVPKNVTPYYFLPFRFTRNQVGSYGEQFRYQIQLYNSSYSRIEPDVILKGYNTTLFYFIKQPLLTNQTNPVTFRFHETSFRKPDGRRLTREDLMTVLAYIDTFLIRMYPTRPGDGPTFMPSEAPMVMDASTQLGYHGLGKVTRVEECRCPHGYRGTSCELCDFGYHRVMRFLRTGACMPWEWHREEYYKVSTSTTMRNYHYV
ncbi:hypothetical protein RP20_CCG017509 [Aedes albopictus]|nr:hypothetical protein RP20_CCG017509 [Aedes albopictus]